MLNNKQLLAVIGLREKLMTTIAQVEAQLVILRNKREEYRRNGEYRDYLARMRKLEERWSKLKDDEKEYVAMLAD